MFLLEVRIRCIFTHVRSDLKIQATFNKKSGLSPSSSARPNLDLILSSLTTSRESHVLLLPKHPSPSAENEVGERPRD